MGAQQFQREGSSENGLKSGASGSSRNATDPGSSQNGNSHVDGTHAGHGSALLRDRIDFWHRFALYSLPSADGFAAISARVSSFLERTANNVNHSGASASANPQNPEPLHGQGTRGATSAADQASASSTMAVIQRDASADGFAWRGAQCSADDKNPDDQVRPTVVPDDVIQPESDKYWAPHPKTGVFAPIEQNGRAGGDHRPPPVDGSVLEEKAWFRPLEDVDKPHPA
ncbi:uncharacterized protein LOC131233363 isoform X2 [Magnolia sinica]|uniref:uncharacterized protein LOC131233363 isoform X2 n=1 Tax=Magnolia sinica TaxID=86752 RepID=UPI0026598F89|nr:uncharacterized protein LOC131233363 isoform X2 [Magnolia sinica]